jgi:hypothetical protein
MTDSAAELRLNVHRIMVAYVRACRAGNAGEAQTLLRLLRTNRELAEFIEALTGFALGMITAAEGTAAAFGGSFDADALLASYAERLALMNDLNGVVYGP